MITFSILVLSSMAYVLIRSQWVFVQQGKFIDAVHVYNQDLIKQGRYLEESMPYECPTYADYDYMMKKFWVWDVNKFIYDERLRDAL